MNSSLFLRVLSKSSKLCKSSCARPIPAMNIMKMSTNMSPSPSKKKDFDTFLDVLPSITESLVKNSKFAVVPSVADWVKEVLDYNLTGGKKARGLSTVHTYEMVEKPVNITEETMRQARIMGWCVEMLQAYLVVLDDMMDSSTTRRGLPCWYTLPHVGLSAVNDSILIFTAIYQTLKMNFEHHKSYVQILELFNETLLYTSIGQNLDYTMAHHNKNNYNLFTVDRYNNICKFKTSYYTCHFPTSLGFFLANKTDPELHKMIEHIFTDIGMFFQTQDDFIDCYGDESVSGKTGTDIQEGKCTWLAVNALQRCNPQQRAEFELYYGSKDPADVKRIKQLYDDLNLQQLYKEYEQNAYNRIMEKAKNLRPTSSGEILSLAIVSKQLDLYYKRKC